MPAFNGVDIFGLAVKMQSLVVNPPATQINSYCGVDGTEEIKLGMRGGFTNVSGILYGNNAAGLFAAEETFRSYYDQETYVLTNEFGVSYPFVKLDSFVPEGRVTQDAYGRHFRSYTARFRHLIV